jgi:hypothetical protein
MIATMLTSRIVITAVETASTAERFLDFLTFLGEVALEWSISGTQDRNLPSPDAAHTTESEYGM